MTAKNEVALTKSEQYLKSAQNALQRQIQLGINVPKNFDIQGALGYTALKIMDSPYPIKKEVIIDTMIRVAQKGLDPRKDQIYILPNRKGEIKLMESYFGYEKLAYDIDMVEKGSVYADVVREGESIKFVGRTLEHEKSIETLDNPIIGAYAKVTIAGQEIAQYMTAYQISLSWSKTNSIDRNSKDEQRGRGSNTWTVKVADTDQIQKGRLTPFNKNQAEFEADMCKRTVIKNLLKPLIKSYAEPQVAASYDLDEDHDGTVIKEAEVLEDDLVLEEVEETENPAVTNQQAEETETHEVQNEEPQSGLKVEELPFDL